ncbi:O-antigen polymerase [Enterococcus cecorum]|uniref:O-antigen polymerase n=1 Tax=Enterococcus cecorum TaxID=44008 RepID=UPI0006437240|nr:O-antigen polymerase [Enterococcus cecorum]KLO73080.1 hypothetical protein AA988_01235 [Enterococcus cecorum]CAI3403592.1 oligosaccharide repeat unit polymerase [Enterococcus cecorum]
MGFCIGGFSLFLALIALKAYKSIFNPTTFFCGLWSIICVFSQLKLFGFIGGSTYVYILIGIGVFCFALGSLYTMQRRRGVKVSFGSLKYGTDLHSSDAPNYKILWLMMLVVVGYTSIKLYRAMPYLLMNNSMGYVRLKYLEVGAGITINAADYFVNTFFITGFRLACEVIIINELIARREVNKFLVCLLILAIGMNVMLSGGRMILFDLATYALFSIKLNGFKRKWKLNLWQKLLLIVSALIVVYVVVFLTMDRQRDISVFQSIYGNFFGGVSLMTTIIENVVKDNWTWGTMFSYGVLSVLFLPLNVFLKIPYPHSFEIYADIVSPFYNVGATTMNAYTTCWTFFYTDFRIIGVVVFSLFFGVIAAKSFNRFREKRNAASICLYMIMLNIMLYSMIRWQLCNSSYLLALAIIPHLYKRNKEEQR